MARVTTKVPYNVCCS